MYRALTLPFPASRNWHGNIHSLAAIAGWNYKRMHAQRGKPQALSSPQSTAAVSLSSVQFLANDDLTLYPTYQSTLLNVSAPGNEGGSKTSEFHSASIWLTAQKHVIPFSGGQ
jgi:hypothetical protein